MAMRKKIKIAKPRPGAPRGDGGPQGSPQGKKGNFRPVARKLREFALSLPGATEDFPWGERVAKVGGKVFVFLGGDPVPGGPLGLSVKLPASGEDALGLPFTKPTGYGLGKSGWVTASFEPGDEPPIGILEDWIRESYLAIAPKKLIAERERSGSRTASPRSRKDRRV